MEMKLAKKTESPSFMATHFCFMKFLSECCCSVKKVVAPGWQTEGAPSLFCLVTTWKGKERKHNAWLKCFNVELKCWPLNLIIILWIKQKANVVLTGRFLQDVNMNTGRQSVLFSKKKIIYQNIRYKNFFFLLNALLVLGSNEEEEGFCLIILLHPTSKINKTQLISTP